MKRAARKDRGARPAADPNTPTTARDREGSSARYPKLQYLTDLIENAERPVDR